MYMYSCTAVLHRGSQIVCPIAFSSHHSAPALAKQPGSQAARQPGICSCIMKPKIVCDALTNPNVFGTTHMLTMGPLRMVES